jgi:hypothetical protein
MLVQSLSFARPSPNFLSPQIGVGDCSARTRQNRVTWKTPSKAAFVPLQEPVHVAVLATLRSPHANAGMKHYECDRTQPLFHAGHDCRITCVPPTSE